MSFHKNDEILQKPLDSESVPLDLELMFQYCQMVCLVCCHSSFHNKHYYSTHASSPRSPLTELGSVTMWIVFCCARIATYIYVNLTAITMWIVYCCARIATSNWVGAGICNFT